MELVLSLGRRNPQVAFGELFAECEKAGVAITVAKYLTFSAIEQVCRAVRLKPSLPGDEGDELVVVNDYAFVFATPDCGLRSARQCERQIQRGRIVVCLVLPDREALARKQLRRCGIAGKVEVTPINTYLALRTLFTSLDNGDSVESSAQRIVDRCN